MTSQPVGRGTRSLFGGTVTFMGLALLLTAVLAGGCSSGAPRGRVLPTTRVESGPGTLEAARKALQGRWSLLSFEVFPPGRDPIQVKGAGTLLYDEFGNLDMQVRVDPAFAQPLEQAGIPLKDGAISLTGRVAIDLQARTLTYILDGQPPLANPKASGPISLDRPRHYEVQEDTLTLTTKSDAGQAVSIARWKKSS